MQRILKRYFTGIWVFSVLIVLLSFHMKPGELTNSDYAIILSIISGIGIGLWHTAHELWELIERLSSKKRTPEDG